MFNLSLNDIERFWSYVPKGLSNNECWLWKGATNTLENRAIFNYSPEPYIKKLLFSARYIYLCFYGYYNFELLVCHSCDKPRCVNPNHLWLGTDLDNNKDMINKCRDNHSSITKFTKEQIIFIRENYNKYTNKELAKMFNSSENYIYKLAKKLRRSKV